MFETYLLDLLDGVFGANAKPNSSFIDRHSRIADGDNGQAAL